MSLRLEMLQVARLAHKVLEDSTELVARFLFAQQNADGGFKDRKGVSDLYYTAFALDSLIALQQSFDSDRVKQYLRSFSEVRDLDFVHLCCLARCWTAVSNHSDCEAAEAGDAILVRLEHYRTPDGGFNVKSGGVNGTAYGAFLALGAHQDLAAGVAQPESLIQSVRALQRPGGGFANESEIPVPSTNATAAAVTLLKNLRQEVSPETGTWLLEQAHPQGGFLAAPRAPIPDLLSTATSIHALAALDVDFSSVKENCLDFIDSLWTNEGSFYGHWGEDILDAEYTFYALLALGHLSY